jgi:hypothetical protein
VNGGVLVLCEPYDTSALWTAAGLARRTSSQVDVVTGDMLGDARTWEHRVRGDVWEVEITLGDDRRISSQSPRAVLNRLSFAPSERLRRVGGEDADYAVQEFQALFLSWLTALPGPMLNRPSPQFLAGHWRNPAGWAVLAARAGLATVPLRSTAGEQPPLGEVTVLVVMQRIVAPPGVPGSVLDACLRLAALSGDDLLGIQLTPADDPPWRFAGATPRPELTPGGDDLLDLLADVLAGAP